jgi:hypothetical protein
MFIDLSMKLIHRKCAEMNVTADQLQTILTRAKGGENRIHAKIAD